MLEPLVVVCGLAGSLRSCDWTDATASIAARTADQSFGDFPLLAISTTGTQTNPGHEMTRTPFLKPEEMSPEQRRIYDDIVASRGAWINGPYAPMLLQPRLAEPAQKLGEFLRYHTSLAPQLSELAILVVARHWDCDFEWYQHSRIALRSNVSTEIVEAIRNAARPGNMNDSETAVYEFTHALLSDHVIPDPVYNRAKALFGDVGTVELTALVGYYTFIALTLNAHEVPMPKEVTSPQLAPRRR